MKEETVKAYIEKFGRSVYISDADWRSKTFRAFIQPLRYKNKMYLGGSFNELGHYSEGYYLYLGPPDENFEFLSNRALLHTADGSSYKIERFERIYIKEKPIYMWAVIKKRE